ncbi:MAG: porin, partial [Deltaproteobacteria bacterium]|nr:porin [Deltaproteobacteria bacterium]
GGTVNAFYVQGTQKDTDAATGQTTTTDRASVQNGLLPGWINFTATTRQKGLDIKAHFGFAPGINNNSQIVGLPTGAQVDLADGFSKVDSRNIYFQFGNARFGTLKLGRDIGLFMANPILSDMTLLGVGGTVRASEPFNTSFGMIGHGYLYAGFQPQLTYTTPTFGGFSASAGVFNPSQFDTTTGNLGTEKKVPQFQGVVSFERKGPLSGKVWAAGVYNRTDGTGGQEAVGLEGGAKVGFGPAELLVSGFTAKGLSISTIGAQFLVIPDAQGDRLESDGYFAQLTYKVIPDLKLGANYGRNRDKDLTAAGDARRRAYVFGAYYSLTSAITLVGEYVNEKATDILGGTGVLSEQKANSVSFGGILFF